MTNRRSMFYFASLLLVWCLVLGLPYIREDPHRFLKADPFMQYLAVASVVEDGDLDLRNQVDLDPRYLNGQTAQGVRGEWYPLHETLLIFLGTPFFVVLGAPGLWLFNIFISLGIAFICYEIVRRYTTESLARVLSFIIFVTSPLAAYSYSFSIDILSAIGVAATFLSITSHKPLTAGILAGLSVWGRLANVALIPALLIFALCQGQSSGFRFGFLLRFIAGIIPIACIVAFLNHHMFGGVLETGYYHNQFLIDGKLEVVSQVGLWSVGILEGFNNIFFNPTLGIIFSWPLLIPAIALGTTGYYKESRSECLLALGLMASVILFYAPYAGAIDRGGGPRHFLALYVLSSGFCIFALHRLTSKAWKSRK